ncbi:MAG: hypothetical protein HQK81_02770 [Desulfovibrionaceae bacterium]|nr:hypothetical protein [Desulfovibrionaceae bacterium]MBF0512968.1 hypothetical protein [Desulfovibrionaceae bacterium]
MKYSIFMLLFYILSPNIAHSQMLITVPDVISGLNCQENTCLVTTKAGGKFIIPGVDSNYFDIETHNKIIDFIKSNINTEIELTLDDDNIVGVASLDKKIDIIYKNPAEKDELINRQVNITGVVEAGHDVAGGFFGIQDKDGSGFHIIAYYFEVSNSDLGNILDKLVDTKKIVSVRGFQKYKYSFQKDGLILIADNHEYKYGANNTPQISNSTPTQQKNSPPVEDKPAISTYADFDGFRGLKWGDSPSKDFQLVNDDGEIKAYTRKNDLMSLFEIPIESIWYYFINDKFYSVVIGWKSPHAPGLGIQSKILLAAREKFGKPFDEGEKNNCPFWRWKGKISFANIGTVIPQYNGALIDYEFYLSIDNSELGKIAFEYTESKRPTTKDGF